TLPLIIHEEKRAVRNDWPAENSTELIATVRRLDRACRREVVARVQRFVPEEVESIPMKCVAAGLGGQIHHPAVEAAEFCRRAVAFDLELLNRVDDGKKRDLTRLRLKHGNAVEQVLVGPRPPAVYSRELRVRRKRDARSERRQGDEAASVERQPDDRRMFDDSAETGA